MICSVYQNGRADEFFGPREPKLELSLEGKRKAKPQLVAIVTRCLIRTVPEQSRRKLPARFEDVPCIVVCLLDAEHGKDVRDGIEQDVRSKVAARADPPAVAEGLHRLRDALVQFAFRGEEPCWLEDVRVWVAIGVAENRPIFKYRSSDASSVSSDSAP